MIRWRRVLAYRWVLEPFKMNLAPVTYAPKWRKNVKYHVKHHDVPALPEEVRTTSSTNNSLSLFVFNHQHSHLPQNTPTHIHWDTWKKNKTLSPFFWLKFLDFNFFCLLIFSLELIASILITWLWVVLFCWFSLHFAILMQPLTSIISNNAHEQRQLCYCTK